MTEPPLPWHASLWQQLHRQRQLKRLPHALLLSGPVGLGKLSFARRLAQAVLCPTPDSNGDACGRCRSCHLFRVGGHPDYYAARPEDGSKVLKIDQIRALNAFLSYTPQYGRYKIVLLEPADGMNTYAANSILKTLEEPPGAGLLLLVTAQPARLPLTVRSRCQQLVFKPPPPDTARAWLHPRLAQGVDPLVLLRVAQGAPLAALAYADGERWRRRLELAEGYEQVMRGRLDPIQAAQAWMQGHLAENLRWLVSWQIDQIRLKMSSTPPYLSNPDLRTLLQGWAECQTPQRLFERLDTASRLLTLCATTPVKVDLLLEAFLSDLALG